MTPSRRAALAGAAALAGCAGTRVADPSGIEPIVARAMADGSTSLLIARDGRPVAERYAPGWDAERPREVASVAKSMVAVLVGMAIEDGFIAGLDQPAADFIPPWRGDGRAAITLRHLMSMTSGLDDSGLALRGIEGDQFAINAAAPLRHPPGARWAYNTAAYHLLFHLLARAAGEPFEAYAARRLLGPLGLRRTRWIANLGVGAAGPVTNLYSAASTARDLARFGEMVMAEGRWRGRRLVSAEFIRTLLTPSQTLNPSYGLLWWLNALPGTDAAGRVGGYRFPRSPRDAVAALGAGGQAVLLAPSHRLVIVRQGDPPRAADLFDDLVSAVVALPKDRP